MPKQPKQYSAELKAKVAIEAIKGHSTVNEIASSYGLHPNLVLQCNKHALDQMPEIFSNGRAWTQQDDEHLKAGLYQQIGQLKVELDWLKKKLDCSVELKRQMIEADSQHISVRRQCRLLNLSRGGLYYEPKAESDEKLRLMRLLDEQYTRRPFYGIRRMRAWLRSQGYSLNDKRVERLLRVMGLEAI